MNNQNTVNLNNYWLDFTDFLFRISLKHSLSFTMYNNYVYIKK